MKSNLYFKHDIYATTNDRDLRAVCKAYPVWGEAVFFSVLTMLYRVDGEDYVLSDLVDDVADALYTDDTEKIEEIINAFISRSLLKKKGNKVWSVRVKNVCNEQKNFKKKQAERGRIGGLKRVKNNSLQDKEISSECLASAKQPLSECQANNKDQDQDQDNNYNLVSKEPRFVEKQVFHAEENAESEETLFGENEKIPTHREQVPYKEIMTYWNEKVHGILPQVEKLTEGRKSHIRQRWAEYGERVYRAIDKCIESDFLSGRSKEWQCDFDWVFLPSHMVRILEGKYDNRTVEEVHPRHKDYSDIGKQNADDFSWEC